MKIKKLKIARVGKRWTAPPVSYFVFKMLVLFCLAMSLSFLFSSSVHASGLEKLGRQSAGRLLKVAGNAPTFSVNAGFHTRYRDNNWIPVQITLRNSGSDFSGTISITTAGAAVRSFPAGNVAEVPKYQAPITLPNGTQKQITLYVPIYAGSQSIVVSLLDSNGNVVSYQNSILNAINASDIFVGILSDQNAGFSPLAGVSLPGQNGSVITEPLDATTMPALDSVLENFNLIVLDNFSTATLSREQLVALQTWINQGGTLIVVGGPEWQRTLQALPSELLPVLPNGTSTLPAGTSLLPLGGPTVNGSSKLSAPVVVSTGTIGRDQSRPYEETLLGSGSTPLIVQAQHGQGTIYYLAYDPTLQPIVGWTGASALWKGLLLRMLGDKLLTPLFAYSPSNPLPGLKYSLDGVLQTLLPNALPSPWILIGLLVGYLLVLGPIRLLIVRWFRRGNIRRQQSWSWRIVLSSIVVFTLLSYGLALQEKGTSILSNSISIVQLNAEGSSARVTSYVGVFVPNQGDFQVHVPGNALVQPSPIDLSQGGLTSSTTASHSGTTVRPGTNGTDVNLLGVDIWTLRAVVSEQDRQMHGGIVSHLTIENGIVTGTITNTLNYGLSDVYVLLPNSYASVGHLASGQTKQINVQVNNAPTNPNAGVNLASQITGSSGLTSYYGNNGQKPQSELQRHLIILSALSGNYNGYMYCFGGACTANTIRNLPAPSIKSFGVTGTQIQNVRVASSGWVQAGQGPPLSLHSGPGGGPGYVIPGSDPLLIGGTQPTLIGWADNGREGIETRSVNSTDGPYDNDLTINGTSLSGLQESMIQAPLSINYSGILSLPASLVGQVVDIQGNDVQSPVPGVYTFSTGSMTFEFDVPGANPQINSMTLSESSNLVASSGLGGVTDISQNAHLYNWNTHSWDSISLTQQSFTTEDPGRYVGPGGRVLVQFSNSDSTLGTVVFGKPSLDVKGVIGNP